MKNIFVYILILAVIALVGVLAWQFWPTIFSPEVWSCGDTLAYQGKDYDTIQIVDQCWFAENLDYDNGCSEVPWTNITDEGWCGYYDGTDYGEGLLYQWSAGMDSTTTEGAKGLCPDGWHIPSDADWKILEGELGMSFFAQDKRGLRGGNEGSKIAGNAILWTEGELENDYELGTFGLDILPAGCRGPGGGYVYRSLIAYLWSSTESDTGAWSRSLGYDFTGVQRETYGKVFGFSFSVRCLKD